MKKETYDYVGTVSIVLGQKLDELKACQEEKKSILAWIDNLTAQGLLEENAELVRSKMSASINRLAKVVAEIESLKTGGQTGQ